MKHFPLEESRRVYNAPFMVIISPGGLQVIMLYPGAGEVVLKKSEEESTALDHNMTQ